MSTVVVDGQFGNVAPERSLAQRLEALDRANEVRCARAQLKRDVKAGRVSVVAVLSEPPACVESMRVFDLLLTVPGKGRVKVNALLRRMAVSPSKTIGGLTLRQRSALVEWLR